MTTIVSGRTAARLCVAAGVLALGFGAAPAQAVEPPPSPSLVGPLVGLLAPSPSPSPSSTASPSPLDPVLQQLPAPVASPVREVVKAVTGAPAPAPQPAPAPAPAPAPVVRPNNGTSPQQVAAPATGVATFPGLRAGSFNSGSSFSGLPPLSAGMRSASLDRLFSVPDVTTPVAALLQAAPTALPTPSGSMPAGLPALVMLIAVVTVGGAGAGQLAVLRAPRQASTVG